MKTTIMTILMVLGMVQPMFANAQGGEQANRHGGGHAKRMLRHRGVEQRVVNQERRIDHKEANGKMTAEQAQVEREKVNKVAAERAEMIKTNGGKPLTKEQRQGLNKELNETSKEIKGSGSQVPVVAPPASN